MTILYNKEEQKGRRRYLRKHSTIAEIILWKNLKNKKLGVKFRRQYSIGKYILDFYCQKLKLDIEIDGATHETKKEINHDNDRKEFLESLGLTVKRYRNIDVKASLESVLDDLRLVIEKLIKIRGK